MSRRSTGTGPRLRRHAAVHARGEDRARRFYEREGWSLVRPPAFDERIGLEIAEYRRAL